MSFFQVKQRHFSPRQIAAVKNASRRSARLALALAFSCTVFLSQTNAQTKKVAAPRKLPAADRIVSDYVKAVGGKKRLAAVSDATYEWTVKLQDQPMGVAKEQVKAPVSVRTTLTFGNGIIDSAANPSSTWERGLDGAGRTLTDAEAGAAKLQAMLQASRLVDYKRLSILARTIAYDDSGSEPVYVVEFSMRSRSSLRYSFSVARKVLLQINDDARKTTTIFSDYRPENEILEAHRKEINSGGGNLTFLLQRVTYNTGLTNATFDPPTASETFDIAALMRDVSRNQDILEERTAEYSFLQKETTREINERGELKKKSVKVYEVFPIANHEPVTKLISEDGAVLSGERAVKEEKRVAEEMEKAEKESVQNKEKQQRREAERAKKRGSGKAEDEDPDISQFLRACEFVSPRRERFRDRDTIVFDFRPRPNFRPANRSEALVSKLVGVVWIDPVDKQVIRMEARLAEGFKMGGGLLVSLKPGAAMVMEQKRMDDGVWLPRLAHFNLSIRVLLFGGGDINKTFEWSDYKHFKGAVDTYKLESPPVAPPVKPNAR
ncbi:MAG: hypothetical protein QOE77_568 [Blastocatellia bacterium]|jgi:hypothetical protein|nr:hypothetical protein [Blastocatellia bacterium]